MEDIAKTNVVAIRKVRTLTGKASHFASMVYVWRPFLSELWGALQDAESRGKTTNCPTGCLWVRKIMPALIWFKAFLQNRAGSLKISYRVDAYQNRAKSLRIVGDACVFGLGAYLIVDGEAVAWYAVPLNKHDEHFLGLTIGDEKCQQTAECLNLLVALRLWKEHWCTERVSLEVRADNIAALQLVLRLLGSTDAMNKIARELALDLGDASFRPDMVVHTPGVASNIADSLSRRFCPGENFSVPQALLSAVEHHPPTREESWWKTVTVGRSIRASVGASE